MFVSDFSGVCSQPGEKPIRFHKRIGFEHAAQKRRGADGKWYVVFPGGKGTQIEAERVCLRSEGFAAKHAWAAEGFEIVDTTI